MPSIVIQTVENTSETLFQRSVKFGGPSPTLAINEQSRILEQSGKTVYKLGFGQSPFPVPTEVVQSLRENAHQKDYLPVMGFSQLRESVAQFYLRQKIVIEPSQVMIGPGSKELIFLCQMALKASLLLPSPSWVSYEPQALLLERPVFWINTQIENDWKLKAKDLALACQKIEGTKLLILNYPNNPTGNTYTDAELAEIAYIAQREDLLIISDEIYSLLNFNRKNITSIANHCPEKSILSSGLSKWAGAGGWRLGTFVFPKSQKALQQKVASMASETFSCVSAPIQYAAVQAFKGSPNISEYQEDSRAILNLIGNYVAERLIRMKVICPKPQGGFYVFPSFENHRGKLESLGIHNSKQLCDHLLQHLGIALLPGVAFGRPEKELSLRLSYVDFDGAQILEHLQQNKNGLQDPNTTEQFFPKISKAMNLLERFLLNS